MLVIAPGVTVTVETIVPPLLCLLLGYALGSVPFGLLLTRAAGLGDVRAIGSGNIGATNVLRTGRKGLAAATLLLDAGKGAAAVLLAGLVWPEQPQFPGVAAIGAFLGHLYPLWLGFKGGKGVATLIGVICALHWPSALAFAAVWLATMALTRYSSVSGMAAAVAAAVAAGLLGRIDLAILFAGFALLVLWKHRANIARLVAGTEPRVGAKGG
jgi:acyl phosphate:glycerol-3-phosphate acyltransferase